MNKFRKQRTRMWENNPHCENCGVLTVLPHECPGFVDGKILKCPDNMATIQHVYSRLHPERWKRNLPGAPPERKHLLWCFKCNQDDCKELMRNLPIEEKRRRAAHPKKRKDDLETSLR